VQIVPEWVIELLNGLSIRARIITIVAIAITGFAVFGGIYAYHELQKTKVEAHKHNYGNIVKSVLNAKYDLLDLRRKSLLFLVKRQKSHANDFTKAAKALRTAITAIKTSTHDVNIRKMLDEVTGGLEKYRQGFGNLVDQQDRMGLDEAQTINLSSGEGYGKAHNLDVAIKNSASAFEKRINDELEFGGEERIFQLLAAFYKVKQAQFNFMTSGKNDDFTLAQHALGNLRKKLTEAYFEEEIREELATILVDYEQALKNWHASYHRLQESIAEVDNLFAGIQEYLDNLASHVGGNLASLEQYASDAQERAEILLWVVLALMLAGMLLVGYVVGQSIILPLGSLTKTMVQMAGGDHRVDICGYQKHEIGAMVRAMEVFKSNAVSREKLEQTQAMHDENVRERTKLMERSVLEFEKAISTSLVSLGSAACELSVAADDMEQAAVVVNSQSTRATSSVNQARNSIDKATGSTRNVTRSIKQVEEQTRTSSEVSQNAVEQARNAKQTMEQLSLSAGRIGEVIDLIQDVAEQTNLLALNATIEAARAGEAGKGFAVVASEVKALAAQTSRATDEIAEHIASIQKLTRKADTAIANVDGVIGEISQITSAVSVAVEEQNAAIVEIADNTSIASEGVDDSAKSIEHVQGVAASSRQTAQRVNGLSNSLDSQSKEIRDKVGEFLKTVQAA
jgi:methyl-accepting chemotaxis protein